MDYFNTTNEEGAVLVEHRKKAKTQEEIIKGHFKRIGCSDFGLSPSQVRERCFDPSTPLTSVRRAMTNLSQPGGVLRKTTTKVEGPYGRKEHVWVLRDTGLTDQFDLF